MPDSDEPAPRQVPFTILTGWLGAGKTSALNRVLGAPHGRRLAILVNELGRIAIDSRLILRRGGDILELAGGCVCCKVDIKNDLWDGIHEIISRAAPDQVVLETTGIAEPSAILDGMSRIPAATRARITPAGVVCVVDAEMLPTTLSRREEAREQLACADRVLMAKLDLANTTQVAAAHAALDTFAPNAERASFPLGEDGDMSLTSWLLEVRKSTRRATTTHHAHRHGQLVAVAFSDDAPLHGPQVLNVARSLGENLVRAKGFVHVAGDEHRWFLELAGAHLTLTVDRPWNGDARRSELVFIGEGLEEQALRRALWACRVGS